MLLRWVHVLGGITWIGFLYQFNFVQAPAFEVFEPETRGEVTRKLLPRNIAWFRYSALVTFLAGVVYFIIRMTGLGWDQLGSDYAVVILSGLGLGTLMFLNVWGVIWPKTKIVIGSAEKMAAGGQPDPAAAEAARRGLLVARTSVIFSIPMLFFMISAGHRSTIAEGTPRLTYGIFAIIVVLVLEVNSLSGLTGASKKPLEGVGSVIFAGFILLAVLFLALQLL